MDSQLMLLRKTKYNVHDLQTIIVYIVTGAWGSVVVKALSY
jgi:hypothetical protein